MSFSINNSAVAHAALLVRPQTDDATQPAGQDGAGVIDNPVAHLADVARLRFDDHPQQRAPKIPDPIGPVSAKVAVSTISTPIRSAADLHARLGAWVALNPQPLPPVDDGRRAASDLNPQPLPPRWVGETLRAHRFDAVALNPQPLPPRWLGDTLRAHLFDAVALNPQPLPPKESALLRLDDFCGNGGHRPVPPVPGPRGGGEAT